MTDFTEQAPPPPERGEWGFVEELQQPQPLAFAWSPDRTPQASELDLRGGVAYRGGFHDEAGHLATAEDDLRRFLAQAGLLREGGVPITTGQADGLPPEGFRLNIGLDGIRILAGEREGIRRGIYFLEDLLLGAEGPFLTIGHTERTPWLRNRVSRCFFGPIKRPPFHRDELMDDIDYYPDEYLNRLAHEGVNGLWLTLVFRDLCQTSITPLNPHAQQRLAKLRRTVEKCLRYGIKTWAFCIEPAGFFPGDPLLQEHPELRGAPLGDRYCFCPSSEVAQRYLYESTNWLFAQVPSLGGLLDITHGERGTTCLSSVACAFDDPVDCPRCGNIPKWQILDQSLRAMRDGMRAANPDAQFISWFYMPTPLKRADWVFEAAGHVPDGVILQYNFESNCMKQQLGVPRIGGDYWLSVVGPCDDFARVAARARHAGTELSAKIQVGCSHEVATIPFVPVPGLLYRKYRRMHAEGCSHVMQCWYFGNYPGVMNRAAGALAYESFEGTEQEFLLRLARPDWGTNAETVVQAWQLMADGYSNYPLTNVFQYYGPIQDGIVWPLYLKPAMKPLAPSWIAGFPPSGDTVGECLEHFTLAEALSLCEAMSAQWQRGVALLTQLRPRFERNRERLRDIGLAETLGIQIRSGRNVLRFYYLRYLLINDRTPDPLNALDEMKAIVQEEIVNAERLFDLCAADPRLGFHSEAETHQYYPSKLQWRVRQLRHLLATDFPEVRQRVASGGQFPARVAGGPSYRCGDGWVPCQRFRWRMDRENGDLVVRADCHRTPGAGAMLILHLTDKAGTRYPISFRCNPENSVYNDAWGEIAVETQSDTQWSVKIVVPALSWNLDPASQPAYFSLHYAVVRMGEDTRAETWPVIEGKIPQRLRLGTFNPQHLAFLQ